MPCYYCIESVRHLQSGHNTEIHMPTAECRHPYLGREPPDYGRALQPRVESMTAQYACTMQLYPLLWYGQTNVCRALNDCRTSNLWSGHAALYAKLKSRLKHGTPVCFIYCTNQTNRAARKKMVLARLDFGTFYIQSTGFTISRSDLTMTNTRDTWRI